jgi:hypothetical protein
MIHLVGDKIKRLARLERADLGIGKMREKILKELKK